MARACNAFCKRASLASLTNCNQVNPLPCSRRSCCRSNIMLEQPFDTTTIGGDKSHSTCQCISHVFEFFDFLNVEITIIAAAQAQLNRRSRAEYRILGEALLFFRSCTDEIIVQHEYRRS
eukprot:scaffold187309_cov38-Prasinocladus_malaysianus.AAC.1